LREQEGRTEPQHNLAAVAKRNPAKGGRIKIKKMVRIAGFETAYRFRGFSQKFIKTL
jgi:hypothetical protein